MISPIPGSVGSWTGALRSLVSAGLRPGAFIDVGCADGHHGLFAWCAGLLHGGVVVNIDANPIYEPTLRRIQAAIGGHYRISAVSDRAGALEFHRSAHPYWSSGAGAGDAYWATVNGLRGDADLVPCATLDELLADMDLTGALVLKLDIQGLEAAVLRGASVTLSRTAVVICEMQLAEFNDLHSALSQGGFDLFDVTNINRTEGQTLGWFDGVYVNRACGIKVAPEVWSPARNADVVRMQDERRRGILAAVEGLLAQVRQQSPSGG